MELRAEKVSRRFLRQMRTSNIFYAVKEAELTVPAGQVTEIVGKSGSGKSTLLNMLAGLLAPTSGTVWLDDTDLYSMDDKARSMLRAQSFGIIPQGQTGLGSLTVLENVMLPCRLYRERRLQIKAHNNAPDEDSLSSRKAGGGDSPAAGTDRKPMNAGAEIDLTDRAKQEQRALDLLERVGITHLRDAYPKELSGGEMRRMSIARALMMGPGILLADEPTGDLDDENTHAVLRLLRESADEGRAVLLVTHEREAAAYADCIYRMKDGVLVNEDDSSMNDSGIRRI